MKRLAALLSIALVCLLLGGVNAVAGIDLSGGSYAYDVPAGAYDVAVISFDYNGGSASTHTPAFRIRRLNDDGTDSWIGSFNLYSTSFNLDTDYGPYSANMSLLGTTHYEFTLNRSNGLWDLAINGTAVDFYPITTPPSITNNPQPDGSSVAAGVVIPNKYFSDESVVSGQNAIDLGWATLGKDGKLEGNARDGVGGTGAYRFLFLQATDGSVDKFAAASVPEPTTIIIWSVLGALGFACSWWRHR